MKIIIVALLIGLCYCQDDSNDPKRALQNLDVKELAKDENFLKKIFACLLDKAPCLDFQYVKDAIPLVLENNCGDCNENQKKNFYELTKFLQDKYPEEFKAIIAKYSKSY